MVELIIKPRYYKMTVAFYHFYDCIRLFVEWFAYCRTLLITSNCHFERTNLHESRLQVGLHQVIKYQLKSFSLPALGLVCNFCLLVIFSIIMI